MDWGNWKYVISDATEHPNGWEKKKEIDECKKGKENFKRFGKTKFVTFSVCKQDEHSDWVEWNMCREVSKDLLVDWKYIFYK